MKLNQSQSKATFSESSSLCILGGPGCGKTEVIAQRIAWMISSGKYDPSEIVALTYTRSMAADLVERITGGEAIVVNCDSCEGFGVLGDGGRLDACGDCSGKGTIPTESPRIGTLHALAASWCRMALRGEIAGGAEIMAMGWVKDDTFGIMMPDDVEDTVKLVYRRFRKKVLKRDIVSALRVHGAGCQLSKAGAARQIMAMANEVGFDDLLDMLLCVVDAKPDFGVPRISDIVKCLFVDEAHDLTELHWKIIDGWGASSLTVVGDDAQRIFGFLSPGGKSGQGFVDKLASNSVEVVKLGENYRTLKDIAEAGSRVRAAMVERGECTDLPAVPMRAGDGECTFIRCTEGEMVSVLAATIHELCWDFGERRFQPEEIAILARTWAELEDAQAILMDAGVAASSASDDRQWWSTAEGSVALAMLRVASRGFVDQKSAVKILTAIGHMAPERMARDVELQAIAKESTVCDVLCSHEIASAGLPDGWWSDLTSAFTMASFRGLLDGIAPHVGRKIMKACDADDREFDEDFAGAGEQTVDDVLSWLASSDASARTVEPGSIILSTFHGAKGLEFPAVVVLGACEGSIPGHMDRTEYAVAESGRALYVGMTRARDALVVISPKDFRGKPQKPSPWLLPSGLIEE